MATKEDTIRSLKFDHISMLARVSRILFFGEIGVGNVDQIREQIKDDFTLEELEEISRLLGEEVVWPGLKDDN